MCLTLNILEAYEKSGEAPKAPPLLYCISEVLPAGLAAPPAGVPQVPSCARNCPTLPPVVVTAILPLLVIGLPATANAMALILLQRLQFLDY